MRANTPERRWINWAISLLLAVVFGYWLLRYEAFPEWFSGELQGYRNLIRGDVVLSDNWLLISFQNAPIGYSHSSLDVRENDPRRHYVHTSRAHLRLDVLGRSELIQVDCVVYLDALSRLVEFTFDLGAGEYRMKASGRRSEGNTFLVTLDTSGTVQRMSLEIPEDAIVYSPMLSLALRRLHPGQSVRIRAFDPLSMETAPVTVRALREEPLVLRDGSEVNALVLETSYRGLVSMSWIDEAAQVVRLDTGFGWTMERSSFHEALDAIDPRRDSVDIARRLAVPLSGEMPQPIPDRLTYELAGVSFPADRLQSPRQERADSDGVVRLTVYREARERAEHALPGPELLAATPFIQSDDGEIRRLAADIVAGAGSQAEAARAIGAWVHENIRKETALTVPSAVEVLAQRRGDCNEHAVLAVALARAAGLHAVIKSGLAYRGDASLLYHAWPAVFADGQWIEFDPTWGEFPVNVTHIALTEGDLPSQIDLATTMGRLSARILTEQRLPAENHGRAP